ncbi:MAG: glycosyl hydrolase [Catenulispora sp. 13_1_20CM_3_70_7]|nr:MAG: glycosyl hydrolase [Catenulispora sp. 13_1_20CM_3_70_7]
MRTKIPRRLAVLAAAAGLCIAGIPGYASAQSDAPEHRFGDHLKQVGYFTQWGIYSGNFVKRVETTGQADKLTHVNYAFANVGSDGKCFEANAAGLGDAWADYERPAAATESVDGVGDSWGQPLAGNFLQLRKLKQRHPGLKVLMSIGGFTWSKYFSDAALTPQSRQAFVASCIDLFIKGNLPILDGGSGGPGVAAGVFDGFDIDWEWPANNLIGGTSRPQDKADFTKLLQEFRDQLDAYGRQLRKHFQLTAFLPANPANIDAGFEVRKIFCSLDFATVQGYDFHGTWESQTNQQSALRQPAGDPVSPDFTVASTVDAWVSRGAPRHEIVVGMPYYSRGWTGVPNVNHGLFQTSTGPAPGAVENGINNYNVLVNHPGFTVYRDGRAGFAWLFDGTTFWTFDDPTVLAQKTAFIRRNDLGGAMVWSLDGDTDNGALTTAIYAGLHRHGND